MTNAELRELREREQVEKESDFRNLIATTPLRVNAASKWLVRYCNSYQTGSGLQRLKCHMAPLDFISLAGKHWSDIDNVWSHYWLIHFLRRHGQRGLAAFMSPKELRVWRKLPEVITVWRGCYSFNRSGASFTLKREVAERFPTLNRYLQKRHDPILIEARVKRSDCALKLDRDEDEMVVLRRKIVSVLPLSNG